MYPKWKYHTTEKPVIVYDAKEENALGAEWEESPSSFFEKVEAKIEHVVEEIKEAFEGKEEAPVIAPTAAPEAPIVFAPVEPVATPVEELTAAPVSEAIVSANPTEIGE